MFCCWPCAGIAVVIVISFVVDVIVVDFVDVGVDDVVVIVVIVAVVASCSAFVHRQRAAKRAAHARVMRHSKLV